jgi:hypothetical protein
LERLDRVLDRDVRVEAMRLVEVDVIGLQASQRGVDLPADLAADRPWSAGSSDIWPHTLVAST